MQPNDLAVAGLTADIVGALFLARGLIITKADAVELGLSFIRGVERSTERDPLPMRDRLRQSWNASLGLLFLSAGFGLQLLSHVLPQPPPPPPVESASVVRGLPSPELSKLVIRNVRPAGDSVMGSVYNGTDRVVTALVVEVGTGRYQRFVLADPFGGARPQRPLRTDLSRATRSYEIRIHAPPLTARAFAVPILDQADIVTGWTILSAQGYTPH